MRTGETATVLRVDTVWSWLHDVADPEIPVLSVIDLGIVRSVDIEDDRVSITITPTYTGCPATEAIEQDIESALRARGLGQVVPLADFRHIRFPSGDGFVDRFDVA